MFEIELFICIKMDVALNNLQGLICHKTNKQTNKQTNKKPECHTDFFDIIAGVFQVDTSAQQHVYLLSA